MGTKQRSYDLVKKTKKIHQISIDEEEGGQEEGEMENKSNRNHSEIIMVKRPTLDFLRTRQGNKESQD